MGEPDRRQLVVERILEDEALRGELEDHAASALISWAAERAGALAADPSRSDAAVDSAAGAIRAAARAAAASSEQDPARVIALAEAALAGAGARVPTLAENSPTPAENAPAPAAEAQTSGKDQPADKPRHRRRKRLPGALK